MWPRICARYTPAHVTHVDVGIAHTGHTNNLQWLGAARDNRRHTENGHRRPVTNLLKAPSLVQLNPMTVVRLQRSLHADASNLAQCTRTPKGLSCKITARLPQAFPLFCCALHRHQPVSNDKNENVSLSPDSAGAARPSNMSVLPEIRADQGQTLHSLRRGRLQAASDLTAIGRNDAESPRGQHAWS